MRERESCTNNKTVLEIFFLVLLSETLQTRAFVAGAKYDSNRDS